MAIIPASMLAQQGTKQARKASTQYLGFDFIPLISSLLVFYSIAFVIAKFMQASQLATGGFSALANLFGFSVPSQNEMPNVWTKLFSETGYQGFKFWDIINVLSVLIIIATAINFQNTTEANGNKVQPITWAIFSLLAGFIILTGVSKLVVKLQERKFQSDFK